MNQLNERPQDVRIATGLLWLALAVTCATQLAGEIILPQESWIITLAIYAVSFGLGGLLVFFIWRRHNWARLTSAALNVLGFLIAVPTIAQELRTDPSSSAPTSRLVGFPSSRSAVSASSATLPVP